MKKKVLCLLLLGCFAVTSCCNETKSVDKKTEEVLEENTYQKVEELAGSVNQDTYNYLIYSKYTEIPLYFGVDFSQWDIVQVDLYDSSELCYENILVEDIYDNVIKVRMEKYVPFFNQIVIHDSEGETMTFDTGEFYLEEKSGMASQTGEFIKGVREETDENSAKFICKLRKRYQKEYEIQIECPKMASSYFTKKQTQNKTSTIITYELKEEYKDSLEIAVDFQVLVIDKSTGESFVDMIPYIPFNSGDTGEV